MSESLRKYLSHGYYDKYSSVISLVLGKLGESIVCPKPALAKKEENTSTTKKEILITSYFNQNATAKKIQQYLISKNHPAIHLAIVAGSISDNTDNKYSDFDGILIIDEEKLSNKSSIKSLRSIIESTSILMKSQDALQHHGWMILWKGEINNYNENYLPSEIFVGAKTLYPEGDHKLILSILPTTQDKNKLRNLAKSIRSKLNDKANLKDFYYFKNLISELLLSPAIFLQSCKNINCSKKTSFEIIDQHISAKSRATLREIERFRKEWNQENIDIAEQIKQEKYKRLPLISIEGAQTPSSYLLWLSKNESEINEYLTEINNNL